jgi:hypothetical protein
VSERALAALVFILLATVATVALKTPRVAITIERFEFVLPVRPVAK